MPTELRALALALAAACVLAWLGPVEVLDRDLRRTFYAVRGARPATASVILVAIDDATVDVWGPPPWDWARLARLIERIDAGGAKLTVVLEPGLQVARGARPAALEALAAKGRVILPPADASLALPGLVMDDRGTVEAIALGSHDGLTPPGVTSRALRALGLGDRTGRLEVDLLGPRGSFPTLAAHRVEAGELPVSTFAGRVVVIGIRGEGFATAVPTPVGALAPAEVHAHAIHALVEARELRRPAAWMGYLGAALVGLLALLILSRAGSPVGWIALLATGGFMIVGVGYVGFARFGLELPLGLPLVTGACAGVGALLVERARATQELVRLARWTSQGLALEARDRETDPHALGRRFLQASRTFVDHAGSGLLTLAPLRWHLELGELDGMVPGDLVERRRDVRRDPWRLAYTSQRPTWANRPVVRGEEGSGTLIVPIVAFTRLLGFWILGVAPGQGPDDAAIARIELLAGQFALELEGRRLEHLVDERTHALGPLDGRLARELGDVRDNALALARAREDVGRVVLAMPVGVLTASMWGEVDLVNDAMRRLLTACAVDADRRIGLEALLTTITKRPAEVVQGLLRDLATNGGSVRLTSRPTPATGPHAPVDLILARLDGRDDGGPRFVLTATTRDERPLAEMGWDVAAQAEGGAPLALIDVGKLVRDTVDEVQRDRTLRSTRALIVEVPHRAPEVLVADEALRDLLRELFAETLRHGPASSPGRVTVSSADDTVIVRLSDPAVSLPAGDVARVLAGTVDGAPDDPLVRLARAKARVEQARCTFELESDLEHGTVIVLRMPKPGK